MGNLFAECRRYSLDQCELCNEVVPRIVPRSQGGRTEPTSERGAGAGPRHTPSGAAWQQAQGRNQFGNVQDYQPANVSEAELLQQALRMSRLDAEQRGHVMPPPRPQEPNGAASGSGGRERLLDEGADPTLMAAIAANYALNGASGPRQPSDDEAVAQAMRASKNEEENRERARLRDEQAREYEESLLIDQQREEEAQRRQREEEEEAQRRQREEEERRRQEEEVTQKAEADERARRERVQTLIEEARARLSPEPPPEEPGRCVVQVRIPDGRRLKRTFRASDSVGQLYDLANAEGGEALASQQFLLVSAMPRVVYEDRAMSLEAAQIQGQCALFVEIIDD